MGVVGRGRILIDRLRSSYDIWKDVVGHAINSRPNSRGWEFLKGHLGNPEYTVLSPEEKERSVSIVRISGIVQEALGQEIHGL